MATKAYVLIETSVGKSRDVANELRSLRGVQAADNVTGPYDVIAVVGSGPDRRRRPARQPYSHTQRHSSDGDVSVCGKILIAQARGGVEWLLP